MRLPHQLVESLWFSFDSADDLIAALGDAASDDVPERVHQLSQARLPPVVSSEALATMLGLNSGILWSFVNRPQRHYRTFKIPKGHGERQIEAPRVALKVLQRWLSHHICRAYNAPDHVYGFIPGRSHIGAALVHADADWAMSVDVLDFFKSTPLPVVADAYRFLGYDEGPAQLLASLSCYKGALAQGAPTSPPLSNVCFRQVDSALAELATQFEATVTRYADDIVFSGGGTLPDGLKEAIHAIFAATPWELNEEKFRIEPLQGRIKVHGLVVGNGTVRLTKGYRNKIRAYAHILRTHEAPEHERMLRGHIAYARHVSGIVGHQAKLDLDGIPPAGIPASIMLEAPASKEGADRARSFLRRLLHLFGG